jgi:riboflavin kinase/FMN adenylyltransferase
VKGKQLGRTIGFPTLNIDTGFPQKLLPKQGVYAVRLQLDGQQYGGMMNIGYRPTVSGIGITIEVHVFDFAADVYGHHVNVEIIAFLREEQKFEGLQALTAALQIDKQMAIATLSAI